MTEQLQVIDKLLIQDLEVSLPWNTCVVCLLLLDVLCIQEKLRMRNVYPPLNLTKNLWCWETPEMSVIKKLNNKCRRLHVSLFVFYQVD